MDFWRDRGPWMEVYGGSLEILCSNWVFKRVFGCGAIIWFNFQFCSISGDFQNQHLESPRITHSYRIHKKYRDTLYCGTRSIVIVLMISVLRSKVYVRSTPYRLIIHTYVYIICMCYSYLRTWEFRLNGYILLHIITLFIWASVTLYLKIGYLNFKIYTPYDQLYFLDLLDVSFRSWMSARNAVQVDTIFKPEV